MSENHAIHKKLKSEIENVFPVIPGSIKPLKDHAGLFECDAVHGPAVLRICGRKTLEEQRAELQWLEFLDRNGIGVAAGIQSRNGHLVETLSSGDHCVLFHKAEGESPDSSQWNSKLIEQCGELIARLHNLSEENNRSESPIRINDWHVQDEYHYEKHIPETQHVLIDCCRKLYGEIQALEKSDAAYGVIHSDIWQGNFFLNKDKITLIDFQDCEQHYFLNDLAVFIYFGVFSSYNGHNLDEYAEMLVTALFRGYLKERELTPQDVRNIPLFLKLREILSLNIFYCYYDLDHMEDDERVLLNYYRRNIEKEIPVLDLDFAALLEKITPSMPVSGK